MAQKYAKSLYNSAAWRKCRKSYIQMRIVQDGGLCEECHVEQGYIVHHKVKITKENITDADVIFNQDNLMYVCKACHDAYEGHGAGGHGKALPLCLFDQAGQPVSLRNIDHSKVRRDGVSPPCLWSNREIVQTDTGELSNTHGHI